jgi:hypothetical protein
MTKVDQSLNLCLAACIPSRRPSERAFARPPLIAAPQVPQPALQVVDCVDDVVSSQQSKPIGVETSSDRQQASCANMTPGPLGSSPQPIARYRNAPDVSGDKLFAEAILDVAGQSTRDASVPVPRQTVAGKPFCKTVVPTGPPHPERVAPVAPP